MSALYVKCPSCGPLLSFIPQGNQFNLEVKCTCGARISHTENCNNSQPAKEYREALNRYHGKHSAEPVQQTKVFTNDEHPQIMNTCQLKGG